MNRSVSFHNLRAKSFSEKVDGNELKLVIFADDMTSFVRDTRSHLILFNTINLFSSYSGLCINHDKTEILLLGNMEIKASELGVKEIRKVVSTLPIIKICFTR